MQQHNIFIFSSSTMKTFIGIAAIFCLASIASGQFTFPGFGAAPGRPAAPARGLFQAGAGGGGCTPTPNHQFGGRNYWVGWRTCGTEFRADQVQVWYPDPANIDTKLAISRAIVHLF